MRQVRTARDCALSLLEYRDRTEAEMRRKLKEREYAPEAVEETIYFLKEYHYLDDQEYARKYVRTAGAGEDPEKTRKLAAALGRRGFSFETIRRVMEELTDTVL